MVFISLDYKALFPGALRWGALLISHNVGSPGYEKCYTPGKLILQSQTLN